jgi:hypothetical protein
MATKQRDSNSNSASSGRAIPMDFTVKLFDGGDDDSVVLLSCCGILQRCVQTAAVAA